MKSLQFIMLAALLIAATEHVDASTGAGAKPQMTTAQAKQKSQNFAVKTTYQLKRANAIKQQQAAETAWAAQQDAQGGAPQLTAANLAMNNAPQSSQLQLAKANSVPSETVSSGFKLNRVSSNEATSPNQLLESHKISITEKARTDKNTKNNKLKSSSSKQNLNLTNKSKKPENTSSSPQNDVQLVTPAAFLKSVLAKSTNFAEALSKLDHALTDNAQNRFVSINEKVPNEKPLNVKQKRLVQQARVLLVRSHPELITGLSANLAILPSRFLSYFKEMSPTFSATNKKQIFTQRIMMETIKSMPELPQHKNYTYKISNETIFNTSFNAKLDALKTKYADSLSPLMPSGMFMQWSRNMITEIALLAPRVIGASIGGGIGATYGAVRGAVKGGVVGGLNGIPISKTSKDDATFQSLFKNAFNDSTGADSGFIGGKIGQIAATPAASIGLGTVVGVTTGATTGAALNGTIGAIEKGLSGASYGANAFENTGKYVYKNRATVLQDTGKYIYKKGSELIYRKKNNSNNNDI